MNIRVKQGVCICAALIPPTSSASDARSAAMGNAGVASADYMSASLYNPALLSASSSHNSIGLMFTGDRSFIGNEERLTSLENIDTFGDLYEDSPQNITSQWIEQVNRDLDSVDGKAHGVVNTNAAVVLAIPNSSLPMSFFMQGRMTNIYSSTSGEYKTDSAADTYERVDSSDRFLNGVIVADYGVTFSRSFDLKGSSVSFGISPKFQALAIYELLSDGNDEPSGDDLDFSEYGFNMDIGAAWKRGHWQAGIAVKDIAKKRLGLRDGGYYDLNPQATLGGAYLGSNYVVTADIDLNEQKHFSHIEDETQFVRLGAEYSPSNWLHLRLGYQSDMEQTVDDMFTVGIGVSPWDKVHLDFTGGFGEEALGMKMDVKVLI
ncbi:conjugal transfer protein TraF [Vibrio sp. HN007]|uniref:conjugal transfer protein TraF n=1 Tax=Vibrio iocasae TaxID=3098914 RepID=UPI0035D3DB40